VPTRIADVTAANDRRTLALMTGGGGLFYSLNKASHQQQSGWQWKVSSSHLDLFAPPLYLFAVGWNEFRQSNALRRNARKTKRYRPVLLRSLGALAAKRSTMIGLREQYSLGAMEPLLRKRNASLTYQPCATTLIGAIEPCMANRNLLHQVGPKVLSVNLADDKLSLRIGSVSQVTAVYDEVAHFCGAAMHKGWRVELVNQGGSDHKFPAYLKSAHPSLAERMPTISFTSHEHVFEYYKTVTVAASSRGHGVMVPFGLQCATISLITHEKVASFLNDIGHAEWGVEMNPNKRASQKASGIGEDLAKVLNYIDDNRELVHGQILQAQAKLMAITAANMQRFGQDVIQRAKGLDNSSVA
jgi:hypothetical protein